MRALISTAVLLLLACPSQMTAPDAGEEPDAAYDGETPGGPIPILPGAEPDEPEDGGAVVVDARCCLMQFTISDQEPADFTGRLVATYGPAAGDGLALSRDAGTWSTAACMPVKASIQYWFELSPDAGDADAGVEPAVRYDETAPFAQGFGGIVNVFGPVDDCSAVDAGTGMWP